MTLRNHYCVVRTPGQPSPAIFLNGISRPLNVANPFPALDLSPNNFAIGRGGAQTTFTSSSGS